MYPTIKSDGIFITAIFFLYVIAWVLPWNAAYFIIDRIKSFATTPGKR